MIEKILQIVKTIGFKESLEHEIVFKKGDDKIKFLKKELLIFEKDAEYITIDINKNKIYFYEYSLEYCEKSFYIGFLEYPYILEYFNTKYKCLMRKYKISKMLE